MDFDAMRGTEKTVEVSDSFNIALGSQEEVKSQLTSQLKNWLNSSWINSRKHVYILPANKVLLYHLHLVIVAGGTTIRWWIEQGIKLGMNCLTLRSGLNSLVLIEGKFNK